MTDLNRSEQRKHFCNALVMMVLVIMLFILAAIPIIDRYSKERARKKHILYEAEDAVLTCVKARQLPVPTSTADDLCRIAREKQEVADREFGVLK